MESVTDDDSVTEKKENGWGEINGPDKMTSKIEGWRLLFLFLCYHYEQFITQRPPAVQGLPSYCLRISVIHLLIIVLGVFSASLSALLSLLSQTFIFLIMSSVIHYVTGTWPIRKCADKGSECQKGTRGEINSDGFWLYWQFRAIIPNKQKRIFLGL